MLFALDISVNKKAPRTHSVNWGFSPPPPPPQKHHPFFFTKPLLNLETIQPPFLDNSPPICWFFMHPPNNWILR